MGELTMEIDIDTVWKILGVVFACGIVYAELKAIRRDIARLEDKVEVHNKYDRRIVALETMLKIEKEGK